MLSSHDIVLFEDPCPAEAAWPETEAGATARLPCDYDPDTEGDEGERVRRCSDAGGAWLETLEGSEECLEPCVPHCAGQCGGADDGCGGTCDQACTACADVTGCLTASAFLRQFPGNFSVFTEFPANFLENPCFSLYFRPKPVEFPRFLVP